MKQNYNNMLSPNQSRVKSDIGLSEVYEVLLTQGTISNLYGGINYSRWDALTRRDWKLGLFYHLQYLNGARASEVLSCRWDKMYLSLGFLVDGAKGSRNRLLLSTGYEKWFTKLNKSKGLVFNGYTYNSIYYEYRKIGIIEKVEGKRNDRVTHINRYNFIRHLQMQGLTDKEIQNLVGHNSLMSTKGYMK